MEQIISIGKQDFEEIIKENYFYIDKTDLIREWWESGDDVTLITRPRRFGKTLNMSMLKCFFFQSVCRQKLSVQKTFHMEREKISETSGNLSCNLSELCRC